MKKNILFVFALNWMLVGCMVQTMPSPPGTVACTSIPKATCEDDKNDPKNTIYLDTMNLDFECIKAKKGRAIIFTLDSASAITTNSVEIYAKDSKDDWWLAGTNYPNKKKILILAPKKKDHDAFPVGEYEYGIRAGRKCVDPRIHVVN